MSSSISKAAFSSFSSFTSSDDSSLTSSVEAASSVCGSSEADLISFISRSFLRSSPSILSSPSTSNFVWSPLSSFFASTGAASFFSSPSMASTASLMFERRRLTSSEGASSATLDDGAHSLRAGSSFEGSVVPGSFWVASTPLFDTGSDGPPFVFPPPGSSSTTSLSLFPRATEDSELPCDSSASLDSPMNLRKSSRTVLNLGAFLLLIILIYFTCYCLLCLLNFLHNVNLKQVH